MRRTLSVMLMVMATTKVASAQGIFGMIGQEVWDQTLRGREFEAPTPVTREVPQAWNRREAQREALRVYRRYLMEPHLAYIRSLSTEMVSMGFRRPLEPRRRAAAAFLRVLVEGPYADRNSKDFLAIGMLDHFLTQHGGAMPLSYLQGVRSAFGPGSDATPTERTRELIARMDRVDLALRRWLEASSGRDIPGT